LNPFGDYAPQSTRIQGILKGLYDAFTADIAEEAKEEEEAVTAYKKLSATRQRELESLQTTKLSEESAVASKKSLNAKTEEEKLDTEESLEASEAFLEQTKKAAQEKGAEWSERTRLRTEELVGVAQAIGILTAPDAVKIFTNATASPAMLLQITAVSTSRTRSNHTLEEARKHAYQQLKTLASGNHNMQLAKMAATLKLGGHFDQVITMIDKVMELLRKEETADIMHRDRCQSSQNANSNEVADLNHDLSVNEAVMSRLQGIVSVLQGKIDDLTTQVEWAQADMVDALRLRNAEHAQFEQDLKTDIDAIALIEQAIVSLRKYFVSNKVAAGTFLQRNYTTSVDDTPKAEFAKAGKYSSETGGIIGILSMIKEDLEKEVKTSRQEESAAEVAFDVAMAKLQAQIDALEATIASMEGSKAATSSNWADANAHNTSKSADLDAEMSLKEALYSDCSWVATKFESRRAKRKDEMKGLTDAKAYLSGIMGDD